MIRRLSRLPREVCSFLFSFLFFLLSFWFNYQEFCLCVCVCVCNVVLFFGLKYPTLFCLVIFLLYIFLPSKQPLFAPMLRHRCLVLPFFEVFCAHECCCFWFQSTGVLRRFTMLLFFLISLLVVWDVICFLLFFGGEDGLCQRRPLLCACFRRASSLRLYAHFIYPTYSC